MPTLKTDRLWPGLAWLIECWIGNRETDGRAHRSTGHSSATNRLAPMKMEDTCNLLGAAMLQLRSMSLFQKFDADLWFSTVYTLRLGLALAEIVPKGSEMVLCRHWRALEMPTPPYRCGTSLTRLQQSRRFEAKARRENDMQ